MRLAVARDEAFCFYYNENFRELIRADFEIISFSPLHDTKLPEGISGLYLGGGYPELHSEELSSNSGIMVDIKRNIENGMPTLAECGGYMLLTEFIGAGDGDKDKDRDKECVNSGNICINDDRQRIFPMCGVIKGGCVKKKKLVRFGYVEILDKTGFWLADNEKIKGHEFHRFDSDDNGDSAEIIKASDNSRYKGIHISETLWAGWPHLYLPSVPGFCRRFAEKSRDYINRNNR
ncbi:MAG: hypothetical protein K6G03_01570 [Lachnospiraceae bacterium]|nr:hypothetical protein [Lachnospiraceae bacterium]